MAFKNLLVVAVAFLLAGLFAIQVIQATRVPGQDGLIAPVTVQGISVEHGGHLHTLNFSQQGELLRYLNDAEEFNNSREKLAPLDVSKLVIHHFDGVESEVILLGYHDNRLVFDYKGVIMMERGEGALRAFLAQTHDQISVRRVLRLFRPIVT